MHILISSFLLLSRCLSLLLKGNREAIKMLLFLFIFNQMKKKKESKKNKVQTKNSV